MKILMHLCCGPCSIYPVRVLQEEGAEVMGFFYKNNIHPYTECLRRQEALEKYAAQINLRVIYQEGYDLEGFIQNLVHREADRCRHCYHDRLRTTALLAKRGKFNFFSSTLLYSKFQKHELVRSIGESIAKSVGVPFFYQNFREGWKEGVDTSKELKMYRQQYCGCIYSEKERFFKS